MTPSIQKLLPEISALSHNDKAQLADILLMQLAEEDEVQQVPPQVIPATSLRGSLKQYAKPELIEQEKDAWQQIIGEKYDHH